MMTQPGALSPIESHGTRQPMARQSFVHGGRPRWRGLAPVVRRGARARAHGRRRRVARVPHSPQRIGGPRVSRTGTRPSPPGAALFARMRPSAAARTAAPRRARRLLAAAGVLAAGLAPALLPRAAGAVPGPVHPGLPLDPVWAGAPFGAGDSLTVAVSDPDGTPPSGSSSLRCRPTGGTHPDAQAACNRLAELAPSAGGAHDPFAPVPPDRVCTQIYAGSRTAHVTGTWLGRPVDATFTLKNGCEVARWRTLEPVLPPVERTGP
jgi:Subtilisin inhibitor-like